MYNYIPYRCGIYCINRLTQGRNFLLAVPVFSPPTVRFSTLDSYNATRLCNIQRAMKAVLSACSNYATKTRQCAHSHCPRIIHERQRESLHWSVKCSVWRRHPFSCLPFPNETQPQRPPCGRQIAALLSRLSVRDSDAVLSF